MSAFDAFSLSGFRFVEEFFSSDDSSSPAEKHYKLKFYLYWIALSVPSCSS
jgi:hypothetical protein